MVLISEDHDTVYLEDSPAQRGTLTEDWSEIHGYKEVQEQERTPRYGEVLLTEKCCRSA